jgi:hypothetical protein
MLANDSLKIGQPVLRWTARAHTIAEIESEARPDLVDARPDHPDRGETSRHIAARTSVMNLVVVARQPEIAELRGDHPGADGRHRRGRS